MLLFCFSFDYLLKLFNFRLKMVQIILKVMLLYNCKPTIDCFLRIKYVANVAFFATIIAVRTR